MFFFIMFVDRFPHGTTTRNGIIGEHDIIPKKLGREGPALCSTLSVTAGGDCSVKWTAICDSFFLFHYNREEQKIDNANNATAVIRVAATATSNRALRTHSLPLSIVYASKKFSNIQNQLMLLLFPPPKQNCSSVVVELLSALM